MSSTLLAENYGTLTVALIVSSLLYGITCCQTLYYLRRFTQDGMQLRIIVVTAWLLETVHTSMLIYAMYFYMVLNHANPSILNMPIWSIKAQVIPAAIAIVLTQCVWITRIWTLNRNPRRTLLAIMMFTIVLLDGISALAWVIKSFNDESWFAFQHDNSGLLTTATSVMAVDDVIAASMLCIMLYHATNGVRRHDNLVKKVLAYTLNTGLLTCTMSVVILVLINTTSSGLYWAALYHVLAKVYVNSLLAMLNWRLPTQKSSREDQFSTNIIGLSLSTDVYSLSEM